VIVAVITVAAIVIDVIVIIVAVVAVIAVVATIIVVSVVVAGIIVIIHRHCRCYHHRNLFLVVIIVAVVSVIIVSALSAPPFFPSFFPLHLPQAATMTTTLSSLSSSYRDNDLRRTGVVIHLCRQRRCRPRPHPGHPHCQRNDTAANVTSRAIVVVLFGTVVAVWAAVGVPLLYGRLLVLARVMFVCLVHFLPIPTVAVVVKRDFSFS
jgi:hypothetical protein